MTAVTLTTAERYRLLGATHVDTSPAKVAERVLAGRGPAVAEVVEEILRERLTEPEGRRSLHEAVQAAAEALCACGQAGCDDSKTRDLLVALLDEQKAGA